MERKTSEPRLVICPYCGRSAEFVDSSVVYGKSYGPIYLCRCCDAYVGVHAGSDKPKGRLANAELRKWKIAAHNAFDPLWKSGQLSRKAAYKLLATRMGLPIERTHIGMFDVEQCKRVASICDFSEILFD